MTDDRPDADEPFPTIAAEYGRTISVWSEVIEESGLTSVEELRAWLEHEHNMGSEHAQALASYFLEPAPKQDAP